MVVFYRCGCHTWYIVGLVNMMFGITYVIVLQKEYYPVVIVVQAGVLMACVAGLSVILMWSHEKRRRREYLYHRQIGKRTKQVVSQQQKIQRLVYTILPMRFVKKYGLGAKSSTEDYCITEVHQNCTILQVDIVGFTGASTRHSAHMLVRFLNDLFSAFDELCDKYGVEKIKTIGDAYVACSGLIRHDPNHARAAIEMALDMIQLPVLMNNILGEVFSLRAGIASGPLVAGTMDLIRPLYDVTGKIADIVVQMETTSATDVLQVHQSTLNLLTNPTDYVWSEHRLDNGEIVWRTSVRARPTGWSNRISINERSSEEKESDPYIDGMKEDELIESHSNLHPIRCQFKESGMEGLYFSSLANFYRMKIKLDLISAITIVLISAAFNLSVCTRNLILGIFLYAIICSMFIAFFLLAPIVFKRGWSHIVSTSVSMSFCIMVTIANMLTGTTNPGMVLLHAGQLCLLFQWVNGFHGLMFILTFATSIVFLISASVGMGVAQLLSYDYIIILLMLVIGTMTKQFAERAARNNWVLSRKLQCRRFILEAEYKRLENNLLNLIPSHISTRLNNGETFIAEQLEEVTYSLFTTILV